MSDDYTHEERNWMQLLFLADPVFHLVYTNLKDQPDIIRRELAAARRRHEEAKGEAFPETLRDWQKAIHQYALEKGWYDNDTRTFGDMCILFASEISEAYEEYRNGHEVTETYYNPEKPEKPEGVPTELADCVIRILDYCGRVGIDLQEIVERKHAYNLKRPYRHGGKRT